MADFFSSRLLRWLIAPYRSRLVNLASKPFYAVADRVLGAQFLADIAEFFMLFQSMYDGFVERAKAVEQTLRDPRTSFVVVSTLEAAPAQEATFFCAELAKRGFSLGALVFNRVLPASLDDPAARAVANRFHRHPDAAAQNLATSLAMAGGDLTGGDPAGGDLAGGDPAGGDPVGADPAGVDPARADTADQRRCRTGFDPATAAAVLEVVGQSFLDYGMLAGLEASLAVRLSRLAGLTVFVPHLDHDVSELAHLLELGRACWR